MAMSTLWPEFNPQNPCKDERRETIPQSSPLTATWTLWHTPTPARNTHTHTSHITHTYTYHAHITHIHTHHTHITHTSHIHHTHHTHSSHIHRTHITHTSHTHHTHHTHITTHHTHITHITHTSHQQIKQRPEREKEAWVTSQWQRSWIKGSDSWGGT